jgi:hypothetical protein
MELIEVPRTGIATPAEVAAYRRVTVARQNQERYQGVGPRFIKQGKRVFYDWADVHDWIESSKRTRTDDYPR